MTRTILPNRRGTETFDLTHGGQVVTASIGWDQDGRVAEVFVSTRKAGSAFEGIARDAAVVVSIALQFGVPLDTLRHSIMREQDGSPTSVIGALLDHLGSPYG